MGDLSLASPGVTVFNYARRVVPVLAYKVCYKRVGMGVCGDDFSGVRTKLPGDSTVPILASS